MRPRSRSLPLLPSQQQRVGRAETGYFNLPIQRKPHGFQLRATMPPPLARRNSFNMSISAHQGNKTLGSVSMTIHRNRGPVHEEDTSQIGRRVHGRTTAYIPSLHNDTFDGFNRGVSGVGSALMSSAEHVAQRWFGAHKISLHPASTTFERTVPRIGFPPWEKQTRKYDPTGFYQHIGYARDPMQKAANKRIIGNMLPPHEAEQWAESRTAMMSKPLRRPRAMSLPNRPKPHGL